MRNRRTFAIAFAAICTVSATVWAQPPGGDRGRGDRGRGDRGGPGGGFDPREIMRRMDTNQNGMLEQSELSDRAKMFVNRAAEQAGLDPSKPIPLDKIFGAMDERRREHDQQRGNDQRREEPKPKDDKVPGFEMDIKLALVPDFSLPADSPLLSSVPLEQRYDKEILERVERTLREYDRNRDDTIDQEEQRRARWSTDPKLSDLNGDGKLNKVELCERYAQRYGNSAGNSQDRGSSSTGGSSSPSSNPSGDRGPSSSNSRSGFDVSRYAESLLRQYDSNRNRVLEREEWSKMRSNYHSADRNRDGKITVEELAESLKAQHEQRTSSSSGSSTSNSSSSASGTFRSKGVSERLADMGVSSSSLLVRNDVNRDGQLQMHEFATSWDDTRLAEFYRYDANRDGVITPQEWVAAER